MADGVRQGDKKTEGNRRSEHVEQGFYSALHSDSKFAGKEQGEEDTQEAPS